MSHYVAPHIPCKLNAINDLTPTATFLMSHLLKRITKMKFVKKYFENAKCDKCRSKALKPLVSLKNYCDIYCDIGLKNVAPMSQLITL